MEFNEKLKQLRLSKGITQQEISYILEIDQSTYAHYESGRRTPDLDKLRRLSAYYNLVDELLDVNSTTSIPLYGKNYRFKPLYDSPIDLARIYPLKQSTAIKLYDVLNPDTRVVSAMLFGSSISMKCTKESDTDIAIRLNPDFTDRITKAEISEKVLAVCDYNADILWFDSLSKNEKVYHDICKGVQIA